jgi:galactoside O-acetyltransferase
MGILGKIKHFCFVSLRIKKYQLLSNCKNISGRPNIFSPILLNGPGKISFGKNIQIGVINSASYFTNYGYLEARNPESIIEVGNNVAINNCVSIVAFSRITIGDDVIIGTNCSILDSDAHDLNPNNRNNPDPIAKPIIIKNNVFLGSGVTILKGVTIGENAVVGNSSVVTKDVPDNAIVAGNPAKIIRYL